MLQAVPIRILSENLRDLMVCFAVADIGGRFPLKNPEGDLFDNVLSVGIRAKKLFISTLTCLSSILTSLLKVFFFRCGDCVIVEVASFNLASDIKWD